jgi:2-dehydro-3-deoxygluconokinase
VGGGDAFVAGFLYGYLSTDSVEQALLWGAATAACKYSIPGDMPVINRDEIAAVISGSSGSLRR